MVDVNLHLNDRFSKLFDVSTYSYDIGLIKIKWKFLDLLQKKSLFVILNMTSRFCHQHTLWATAFLSRLLNLYYADTLSWTMRFDRTVFVKYAP